MARANVSEDRYGLPLTTGSGEAAARYVDGIDRALAGNAGSEACLVAALEADEGFALAQVALARALQVQGNVAEARAGATRARTLAAGTSARERSHVETMATVIERGGAEGLAAVREHLAAYPRDAFVLSQAAGVYGLIGFSGSADRNAEQLALLDGVAEAYGDDWWFLSAHAFAHNEVEAHETARRLVERSLARYPRNGHGAHTLGHVYFETGAWSEGIAYLEGWLPAYERSAQLHCHLTWHLALFELNEGRPERALALYQEGIGPGASQSTALGTLADAASLLWRCSLDADGCPELAWEDVRALAERSFPKAGIAWADVHAALAYAAAGDRDALDRLLADLREREAAGKLAAGAMVVELVAAIDAFAHGEYDESVRRLEPLTDEIVRIGGSRAQREVFEDTLIEAYLRAGRTEAAVAALTTRLGRRHSSRDASWLARARLTSRHDGDVTIAVAR